MKKVIALTLSMLMLMTAFGVSASAQSTENGGSVPRVTIMDFIFAILNKDSIIAEKHTGEVSTDTWSADDVYSPDDANTVVLDGKDELTVLNITDIHLADYGERVWMGIFARSTVRSLVMQAKPDLITVSGDFVCGESTVRAIKIFTQMMDSFKIPWAPVFGNHENDGNCDLNYLAEVMLTSDYCLFKKGPADMGVGNYVVNVAKKQADGSLDYIHSLIMMDSQEKHLNARQIEWYKWAARGISEYAGKEVESSVIFHIPCAEYQYAFDAAWDNENGCWRDGFEASGERNEKICCTRDANDDPVNNGFFAAVKQAGTTKNIICGHDHMNDFSIVYEGVRLTYTLKVGMGSGFQTGFNGCTMFKISDSGLTFRHLFSL